MRTSFVVIVAVPALALGACKWTEFDDLSDSTWVVASGKPDVKSSDYGVAIARGDRAIATGGTLAVIGAGVPSYSELAFSAAGGSSVPSNNVALPDKGVTSFDPQPPFLLAHPTSSEVALITNGDASSIVVAAGEHTVNVKQMFVPSGVTPSPTAATYLQPPKKTPADTQLPPVQPLVGAGDFVLGEIGSPVASCKLVDGATAIGVRALGVLRTVGGSDDVLAWGANGKLYHYPGSVFFGCATQVAIGASYDTKFVPGVGSQILPIDATRVLLQGHADPKTGDAGLLQVVDATTLTPIGNPVSAAGLRTAAVLAVDSQLYAVAGFPTAVVDGTIAGQVNVYRITATGLDTTPVATLHDAQPEASQSFGRSVAALPFNGKQVIAVAANNEIFVYFRANQSDGTALYAEARQGR